MKKYISNLYQCQPIVYNIITAVGRRRRAGINKFAKIVLTKWNNEYALQVRYSIDPQ
jgi:hypothetical protein